jgi:RND family efflux transporter MFP subunit
VAEAQLARVKPSQRAAITVDAIPEKVFPGKVRRILPRADRSKATVKVRVDFLARDEQAVLPDMGVRVRFLADNAPPGVETGAVPDKIVVPKVAVQSDQGGHFVWVVSDGVARRQPVVVGANSGERIEITRGINAGDQVVVRGAARLSGETAEVRIAE